MKHIFTLLHNLTQIYIVENQTEEWCSHTESEVTSDGLLIYIKATQPMLEIGKLVLYVQEKIRTACTSSRPLEYYKWSI